jgi:hypothetical protein
MGLDRRFIPAGYSAAASEAAKTLVRSHLNKQ